MDHLQQLLEVVETPGELFVHLCVSLYIFMVVRRIVGVCCETVDEHKQTLSPQS